MIECLVHQLYCTLVPVRAVFSSQRMTTDASDRLATIHLRLTTAKTEAKTEYCERIIYSQGASTGVEQDLGHDFRVQLLLQYHNAFLQILISADSGAT